jgi:hypothetical protein
VGAEVGVSVVGDVVGARDTGTRLCNVQVPQRVSFGNFERHNTNPSTHDD